MRKLKKNNILFVIIIEMIVGLFCLFSSTILPVFLKGYFSKFIIYSLIVIITYLFYRLCLLKEKQKIKFFIMYIILSFIMLIFYKILYICLIDGVFKCLLFIKLFSLFIYSIFCIIFKYNFIMSKSKDDFVKNVKNNFKSINFKWNLFIKRKYVNVIFKIFPKNLFVFVLFILYIIYILNFLLLNNDLAVYSQNVSDSNIGPIINKDINLHFDNVDINNDVDKFCIVFSTYQRINNSNLRFQFFDKKNNIVYDKKINTKVLNDGQSYCLKIKNIKKEEIKDYHLEISSYNNDSNNYVTIFKNKKTGEYTYSFWKSQNIFSFKYLFLIIFLIIWCIINYIINKNQKLNQVSFFFLMFIYIIPILFIYPPLEIPDEPSHFFSSYNLAQNILESDKKNILTVPENFDCLNYAEIQKIDMVLDKKNILHCLKETSNIKTDIMFGVSKNVAGSFLGFVISAIGIKLADIFTNSSLIIFYCGRLFNLIFSLYIIYKAIKIAPKHKNILLFISTIPMFVQQICSYSYDAILNSICILFMAYMIRLTYNKEKFDIKYKLIVLVIILLILSVKIIYLPILILLLFIPNECFKNKKSKYLNLLTIFIIALLINKLFQVLLFTASGSVIDGAGNKQMQYLLNNPLDLFKITFNTVKLNTRLYLRGIFGYFSWFKFHLWDLSILGYIIMYIILIFSERDCLFRENIVKKKLVTWFSILFMIAAVFGSMYICWSKYKLSYVDGVQGRYFLPILPLLSITLISKKRKISIQDNTLYSFININMVIYIMMLIIQFY